MQKLSRDNSSAFLELQFKTVNEFSYSPFWYLSITSLHIIALVYTVIQRIPYPIGMDLPYNTVFIILSSTYGLFVMVTLLAYSRGVLLNFWGYFLLLLEAILGLVTEVGVKCFSNQCWCAGELKYQILVIVIFGILFVSVSVLRIFYYYPFRDPTKVLSIQNGYTTCFFSLYKLVLSILFNIEYITQPATYKSAFFLLSLLLLVITGNPYHYSLTKRIWNIIHISTFWTAAILFISPNLFELSHSHSSDGSHIGLFLWLFSIPFVVLFTYSWGRQTKWQKFFETVHHNQSKDVTLDSVSQLAHELNEIKKSELKSFNPVYKELITLMEQHAAECKLATCYIKQVEREEYLVKDQKMQSKRMKKNLEVCFRAAEEKLQILLTKQPSNIELTIYIANFLFISVRAKFKALALYNDRTLASKLSLSNYYSLLYLKNSIECQNNDRQQMNMQSLQTEISEFQRNIEVSVSMLTQFWYMLSNNKCDLKKLYDLANTIFPLKMQVDTMWAAIESYKNIDSYNLYARYLIQIFNDKERGLKILEQTKKIDAQIKNRQQLQMGLESSGNIVDENGLLFVELNGNNSCRIFQSNIALERMLGYGKSELVDEPANVLIPKPFADHHDFMVQKYHLTGKTVVMNKQNSYFIKNKCGYLIPVAMTIKPIKNFYSQKTEVYATFKPQLQMKEIVCIYTNETFVITDVSSSILALFPNITPQNLARRRIYIEEIVPNFKQFLKKGDRNLQQVELQRKYEINGFPKVQKISYTVDISELTMSGRGVVGYQIKLGRLSNKYSDIKNVSSELTTYNRDFKFTVEVTQQADPQFQAGKDYIHFVGACNMSDDLNDLFIQSANSRWIRRKIPKAVQKNRIDYSQGIIPKRLFKNIIMDSEPGSQPKLRRSSSTEQKESMMSENDDSAKLNDINNSSANPNIVRSSELSNLLLKEKGNKKVKMLKILEFVVVMSSIVLMVTQYTLITGVKGSISGGLNQIKLLNEMQAEILYINQYSLYHETVTPTDQTRSAFLAQINELDAMQKGLVLNGQSLLTYSDGSTQKLLLNFALNKLVSSSNMAQQISSLYDPLDTNIYFINFNCLNDLLLAVNRQISTSIDNVNAQLENEEKNNKLFIALSFPVMFIMTIVTNVLLFNITKKKTEILEVFFEIPRKTCKGYMKECEVFIQKLASDNQDFEIQSVDGDENQTTEADNNDATKKKRAVEGEDQIWSGFIMAALAFVLFLCSFQVCVYIYKGNSRSTIQNSSSLVNQLTQSEKNLVFAANAMVIKGLIQNSLFMNSSLTILNSTNFEETQSALNNSLYRLRQGSFDFQTNFFSVKRKYSSNFIEDYNQIVFGNLCHDNEPGCAYLSRGFGYISKLGMKYVQMKYDSYVSYIQTNNASIKSHELSPQTLKFELSSRQLMKTYYRKLSTIIIEAIQLILTQIDTVVFAVMLSLIISSFLILYFGWYKFFELIEKQIMATEYILTFIPITEINKNPRISMYVRVHMLERGE